MGCSEDVETIRDKMMLIQLQRMEIQMAKQKELKKLSDIEGRPIERNEIPDYIDPDFARENNIITDYSNIDKVNEFMEKKEKKEKPEKDKKQKSKKDKYKTSNKKDNKSKKKK